MKELVTISDISIRQAMKKLSKSGEKCLIVTDNESNLLGTLSDGDLRKAILKGAAVSDHVKNIYQQKPTVLVEGEYNLEKVKKLFTKNKFDLIPVVNNRGKLVDVLFWETVFQKGEKRQKKKLDVPVVIMAGGKGTRLEPFTKVLPKPLVPIHEKPLIEHIIERFTDVGVKDEGVADVHVNAVGAAVVAVLAGAVVVVVVLATAFTVNALPAVGHVIAQLS